MLMSVQVKKIESGKYEVKSNKEVIGVATVNYKGMYVLKLGNVTIEAVSQDALKRMVTKQGGR
jgi:hypothetical protein